MDDFTAFARLIDALRPWLGQLVLVGGWAHRIYRFHPLANPPEHQPVLTRDVDLAFSSKAALEGDIGAALKDADFQKVLSGQHTPPITRYRLAGDDRGFYAEFLVPLLGDGLKRSGKPDLVLAKAGVTAQKLRHIDLLLILPWQVELAADTGIPLSVSAEIRLPNPVSFIIQKILIRKRRTPQKQAQDILYIYDTLDLFGQNLELLRGIWLENVRPTLATNTVREIERLYVEQFGALNDVIRDAVRIPQDRKLRPEQLQAACAYGLAEIFSPQ